MRTTLGALLMLLCSIPACGDGGSNLCEVNADCDSGFCKADGTCGAPLEDDAGPIDDSGIPDGQSGLCAPNQDGQLVLSEIPLVAGKMANFRVAQNPTFDTAGSTAGDGTRSWDLSPTLTGDGDTAITLLSPTGQYWAADFPTASYATPLSASDPTLLGIFHLDADALTLLGVVSTTAGSGSTDIAYDPPVTILKLPITAGATWESTGNVSGYYMGTFPANYVNYDETYTSTVDAVGTMKTPYGNFPVMRIATLLERTSIAFPYQVFARTRSFAWMAECFGSVANVSSKDQTTGGAPYEFSDPAEVRRLIP